MLGSDKAFVALILGKTSISQTSGCRKHFFDMLCV